MFSVGRYFKAFIFVLCGSGLYVLLTTLMATRDKAGGEGGKQTDKAADDPGAGADLLQPQRLR